MVPLIGALVPLVPVKPEMLPVPLAGIPIAGLLFVQEILFIPPDVETVKFTGGIAAPLHTVWLATGVIVGIGFTTTVAVIGVPGQPLAVGVMVNVVVTGAVVVLLNAPLILPEPLAAIPVAAPILSLVQLYTVPPTLPESTIVVIADPEQMVCDEGVAMAFGVGFTVTVNATAGLTQPPAANRTVILPL
jgi:hypothetical protein